MVDHTIHKIYSKKLKQDNQTPKKSELKVKRFYRKFDEA